MKHLSANEIRQMWLDFFKEKGHSVEPSAPLVPINDPTLLWINAGVAPLKKYFEGTEKPRNPRITNAQKCIRTNDIENVGKTARHHTFFEMLGNFSIGDYFKETAIEYGFELLTSPRWFAFDLDKLYITVYTDDTVAYNKWVSLGVDPSHLIKLEDNFWCIGEGPSGPDTEIFYDRGEKYDKRGKELIEQDIENDRFIEIWNIVFSQYNAKADLPRSEYPELPSKNIDTGSGLERVACVMQEVSTNYDTDLFMPIIKEIERISGVKYEGQMAFKVIADHIRTVTFAISDGAVLSNEGRGYVLRRVLRRATKYGKKLGIDKPFMYNLVDVVIEIMDGFYPYLHEKKDIVKKIVFQEEQKFLETLSQGEKKLDEIIKESDGIIDGGACFMLYDTFGFPIELTEEIANEAGYSVDLEGFKACMQEQKNRARNARSNQESMNVQNEEYLNFKEKSTFVGYDKLSVLSKVIGVFAEGIVLEETPFYATSGGQVADTGTINGKEVLDVKKMPNGQFLHVIENNSFSLNDEVLAVVDAKERQKTTCNHSSAHLLHKSLKLVLGNHVHQQGSLVCPSYMRFDFNNYNSLTDEEILRVEALVNENIVNNHPVITKEMPIEEAKKTGAEALFGEKYGDVVRVVNMEYSVEFCGGTHVKNTSEIKNFAIASVESIGSGIFRCLAYTGDSIAKQLAEFMHNTNNEINQIMEKGNRLANEAFQNGIDIKFNLELKDSKPNSYQYILDCKENLANAKEALKNLEKEIKRLMAKNALANLDYYNQYLDRDRLICCVSDIEVDVLKQLVDALLNKMGKGLVFIASIVGEKVIFVAKNNIGLHCGNLVKEAALITKGNGGGKPDMAQAGGKDITKVSEALNHIRDLVK